MTDERSIWDGGPVTTNFGTGPGTITADGCAVEVYARLPATGEPDIIHGVLAESASVLDLGAGVGRIADPLVDLGHRVVAVDDCAEMLAHVRKAATVLCTIEDVRLPERFDAVLLASFLINTPDASQRTAFFTAARHHLATGGEVLMQWHPPEWFDSLTPGGTYHGGARYAPGRSPNHEEGLISTLKVEDLSNDLLRAVVTYDLADQRWTRGWEAHRLTVEDLQHGLEISGLRLDRFLTEDRTWLLATTHEAAQAEATQPARLTPSR